MQNNSGNPLDDKVREIIDIARQEGYAQGWAAAIISMITAANKMRHAETVEDLDTAMPIDPLVAAARAGLMMQGGPGGSNTQIQYNNNGAFGGTAGMTWHPAVPPNTPTSLQLANELNVEAGDLDPRGIISTENSDTDHSAHFAGRKSRGTNASPTAVQVKDYLGTLESYGYNGSDYERAGAHTHIVQAVADGHLSTQAIISASTAGVEYNVINADTTTTTVTGALKVVDPGSNPGGQGFATVTLFGSQNGDVALGWGIFGGYPNPGDFSVRERSVNTYLTIQKTTGNIINWLGLLMFGGTTSSFPALKGSATTLQARLADDSGFAPIQGRLTTDTAFTAGTVTATGYITIYDSTGRAHRVNALPV
jgi:hypothetical protein